MPAISHKILGDGIVRPLLKAGHEVSRITADIKSLNSEKNTFFILLFYHLLPVGLTAPAK